MKALVKAAFCHHLNQQTNQGGYLNFSEELNQREQAILQAASQIFCSAIAAGKVNIANHAQMFSYSVKSAVRMASMVKLTVVTDEELPWPE